MVKGAALEGGGWIQNNGGKPWIRFDAAANGDMEILGAWIAESAASETNYTPATVPGTEVQLLFENATGSTNFTLHAYPTWPWSVWATLGTNDDMVIDMEKTYAVTFLVSASNDLATAPYYQSNPTTLTSFPSRIQSFRIDDAPMLLGDSNTNNILMNHNWSTNDTGIPLPAAPLAEDKLYSISGVWPQVSSNGLFVSQVFDTHMEAPVYEALAWNVQKPASADVRFKVRSGSNMLMTDAAAWSNIVAITAPSPLAIAAKRYVQFMVELTQDKAGWSSPKLQDVTINWTGPTKITDVVATLTKSPEGGVYEVSIDGKKLVKGLMVDLEIYEDVTVFGGQTVRLTSQMVQEIEPRNTGK